MTFRKYKQSGLVLVYIIILLILPIRVLADHHTDSLFNLLKSNSASLEAKSIACSGLVFYYQKKDKDSALFYGQKGLEYAEQANSSKGRVKNYIEMGDAMFQEGSYSAALDYFAMAEKYFTNYPDTLDMITTWLLMGNVYYIKSDFPKAIDAYLRGLEVTMGSGFEKYRARFYNNLANTEDHLGEFNKALGHYQEAGRLFEMTGQDVQLGYAYNNIGGVHLNTDQNDSAYFYYQKALKVFVEANNSYGLLKIYNNLAIIMLAYDSIAEAEKFSFMALEQGKNLKGNERMDIEKYEFANNFSVLGRIHHLKGDFGKAQHYYFSSYTIASQYDLPYYLAISANGLATTHESMGTVDSALYYYKLYLAYDDTLKKNKNGRKIAQLMYEFELEQQQQATELDKQLELNRQKQLELNFTIVLSSVVLMLIIAVFLILLQRSRMRRNKLRRASTLKELEYKKKQLTTNLIYLIQNRKLILKTGEKLKQILPNTKAEDYKIIRKLLIDLEKNSFSEGWKEFESSFQEVRPGFYIRLNKLHPNLTPNEQKLCAFLSMNMSSKEISTLTLQSLESIRKARYRLRKKLQIPDENNMVSYLLDL